MKKGTLIRLIVLLAIGAVGVAAAVIYKFGEKEDFGVEMRQEVEAIVLPEMSPASRDYVKGLIEWAHPQAYEAAFTSREGLTGGDVDQRTYQAALYAAIIARARLDGQTQTAEELEALKEASGL